MSPDQDRTVSLVERLTIHGLVGLTGAVILWDTASLSGASAIFPRAIGAALICLAAISAVYAFRIRSPTTEEVGLAMGLSALVLLALYIWTSVRIGFVTSSLWFVPALALLGGERRAVHIALLTIGFVLAVLIVFEVLFKQPLPPELILGEL